MTMTKKLTLAALLVTPMLLSGNVLAAGEMSFKGKLIVPPSCTINGGKPIEVDFGDEILTSRVDQGIYSKPLEHGLKCTTPELAKMKLQIKGDSSSVDAKYLKTSNKNLAIEIKADDKPLAVNEWLNFNHGDNPQIPKLTVVLATDAGEKLVGGGFTAAAVMEVDYE